MKNERRESDPLADLLKKELVDEPSAEFSDKLLHVSMTSYRISYSKKYRREELPGKVIIAILISFNIMMLAKLNAFNINPTLLLAFLTSMIILFFLVRLNVRVVKRG